MKPKISYDGVPEYVAYFRLLAFKLAWDVSYRDVLDHTERFGKALVASIAPIRDHDLARAIWRWARGRAISVAIEKGWPVPDIAKPFVRQYLKAMDGVKVDCESCVV